MMRKLPTYLSAVLMLGVVSQVGQVLLLRELLMVFHGNEMSIGLILASWMIWVGIGSALGAVLAERVRRPVILLTFNSAGILLILPGTIFIIRVLRGFFDVLPGAYLSLLDIAVSSFVLMSPVCLLLGEQFVLLSRLWRESDCARDTSGAGKTYIGEAAGNVIGGILFTFVMVRYLNSFQSAVLAGMFMLGAIIWAGRRLKTKTGQFSGWFRFVVIALLIVAGGAFALLGYLDDWAYKLQWRYFAPEHQLVRSYQSKYGTITVVQSGDQYSFFQSGHLIFSTAGPQAIIPALEEQQGAVFAHFSMVQHKHPKSVLLIGGGLRGTLSEIAKHPVERIDYIELDEILTEAARPYVSRATLAALDDPRVQLIHTDGRLFVKAADAKYDMVIVDVPDPATAVLNRYYTEEFFSQARSLLDLDGVFVIGAVSTAALRGKAVANRNATIYHTLKSVFSYVLPAGERFMFYFASDLPMQVTADVHILQQRYLERNIETAAFSHHHFHILLERPQLRRVNWILRNHGRSPDAHLAGPQSDPLFPDPIIQQEHAENHLPPVHRRFFINSDLKPIGYYYTLMFWEDLTRAEHTKIFERVLRIESWWIVPLAGICIFISAVLRIVGRIVNKRPEAHFAVLFAVFTTGLSTMTLQIALLFSFQSIYGFIYEMVGLIVAVFMVGLALGTALTHRYVVNKTNTDTLAAIQLIIAILAGFIAVVLPRAAAVDSPVVVFIFFSTLTFVAGLLNGLDFPLAAACCMALNRRPEKSAGIVYGVELSGACIGAAFAGAAVTPIMGIVASCLLAAIVNTTAFVVLMIGRGSYV